mgnify:CR=1 FL=1
MPMTHTVGSLAPRCNGTGTTMDASSAVMDSALAYVRRGWSVIPVRHGAKHPGYPGWERMRLTAADLPQHFDGRPQNIGLLTGAPSGWVVDIDLDHPRAVELADTLLPPTPAVFGRCGKPRSHRLYRVTAPTATLRVRSKSEGMIIELRSTGCQTVIPPSTHPSGELIAWDAEGADEGAEPALVDPEALRDAVHRLGDAVLVELGERHARRQQRPILAQPQTDAGDRVERCLRAMRRLRMTDHRDGSARMFAIACRCVEHDLSDQEALTAIHTYAAQNPFPRDWSDEEIVQRLRQAERRTERGIALRDGSGDLGGRDRATGRLVLSPRRTLPTAEAFIREFYLHPDGRTLLHYAGLWWEWRHNRYVEVEEDALRQRLHPWLHDALRCVGDPSQRRLIPYDANPATVTAALETLRAYVHLPASTTPPAWIGDGDMSRPPAGELLPCRSFSVHLPTMTRIEPTPHLFTTNALDCDYDPDALPPERWLAFLDEVLGDAESVRLLQTWFGYVIGSDTRYQKMLLLVGPRRAGKGTIARVLTHLVGRDNVCGPTIGSLAGPFGLQPLIGRSLAIVSDARFTGAQISTVVERLLCISGEDILSVDRKFLGSVTLRLPTRFVFIANEMPRVTEVSGALAGRFLVLHCPRSFYGREDPTLTDALLQELPGILRWAVDGWRLLRADGRFTEPASSREWVEDLEDLLSPVGAWVRECCVVGPQYRCSLADLYSAWVEWCARCGREHPGTVQSFARDLAAATPGLRTRRNQETGRFIEGIRLAEGVGDALLQRGRDGF